MNAACTFGIPACSIRVDRPMSRLSKRTTKKPRPRQLGAELLVPGDHLRRQAHDQDHRRRLRVAEGVVAQLYPVGPEEGRCGASFDLHMKGCRVDGGAGRCVA
jgi:hypothetical protein